MQNIGIAGSLIVDKINSISKYPSAGELIKINSVKSSVGGCVPNVSIDLKIIEPALNVKAFGKTGDDDGGKFVVSCLKSHGVDVGGIRTERGALTSFTEVMSVSGGERTFFTYAGADGRFGAEDIDFSYADGENKLDMLHIGYFLLLEKIDKGDGEKILKKAKQAGIKTSIDLVSDKAGDYSSVIPCLAFTDNLIINEIEAGNISGIAPENANLENIAKKIKSFGVKERVIIHKPDLSVCLSEKGYIAVPSYNLPDNFIKGSTGAGDAFCAGALFGILKEKNDKDVLEFASAAAAASLSAEDAVSGLKSEREIINLCKNFDRRKLC